MIDRMRDKLLAFALSIGSLIPLASAQETGIFPLLINVLGVPSANFGSILSGFASYAVLVAGTYIFFKSLFRKAGDRDLINFSDYIGASGGRNIILIFSALLPMVGIFAASQRFGVSILNLTENLVILSMLAGLLTLFGVVLGGGPGIIAGGTGYGVGKTLSYIGKGGEKVAGGAENISKSVKQAEETYQKSREILGTAEDDASDGNLGEAEEELDQALKILEQDSLLPNLEESVEELEAEAEDANQKLRDALEGLDDVPEISSDLRKKLEFISGYLYSYAQPDGLEEARMIIDTGDGPELNMTSIWDEGDIKDFINGNLGATTYTPAQDFVEERVVEAGPDGYGLASIASDLENVHKDIGLLAQDFELAGGNDLNIAVKELDDVISRSLIVYGLLEKVRAVIEDHLEADHEKMDQLAQKRGLQNLASDAEDAVSAERKLENALNQIENNHMSKIENQIDAALEQINNVFEIDQEEVEELKQEIKMDEKIVPHLDRIEAAFKETYPDRSTDAVNLMKTIKEKAGEIHEELEEIEDALERRDNQVHGEIISTFTDYVEGDGQTQLAKQISSDLQLRFGDTRLT